jgi:Terminase small subunit
MQARFAAAYALNGGNSTKAAIEAGYSEKSAGDLGRRALELPHVQEMILMELTRQRARAGAIGLNALVQVAESDKAPAAAKVAAGRALMEFAGLANSAKDADEARWRACDGKPAPDYKAILDTFANISTPAIAATPETVQ